MNNNSIAAVTFWLAAACATLAAASPRYKTLAQFHGKNGARPSGAIVQGPDGNFYSTTVGVSGNLRDARAVVFKVTPAGDLTTLHRLPGQSFAALTLGVDGNFYGVIAQELKNGDSGVFEVTPAGALTQLYTTCITCSAGWGFYAPLVLANDGNFYGTTPTSGTNKPFVRALPGWGAPGGTVTILGNNLTGATSVSFNGTPSQSVTVNSTGSAVTAAIPSGATSGEIQVKVGRRTLKSDVPFLVTQ